MGLWAYVGGPANFKGAGAGSWSFIEDVPIQQVDYHAVNIVAVGQMVKGYVLDTLK